MNESEMKEMIDLQRFKLQAMKEAHERELEAIKQVFLDLLLELGLDKKELSFFGPMCAFNMNATLLQIKERNVPQSYGWHRWHGIKARGEK